MTRLSLKDARRLAGNVLVDTLSRHNPSLLNTVQVEWNPRLRASAGRAWLWEHRIELSSKILPAAGPEAVRQTTIHELAHLHAWIFHRDEGHGRGWRSTMVRFGASPDRCHDYFQMPSVVEALSLELCKCVRCGKVAAMSKTKARNRRVRTYRHRQCGGVIRVLNQEARARWLANGKSSLDTPERSR